MSDVVLRYNHNDSFMVLARTRNKSLKLDVDDKGLMIDATLQDDITDHRNIYNAIKSGLIDKQSFAFTVEEDNYDYNQTIYIRDSFLNKIGRAFEVRRLRYEGYIMAHMSDYDCDDDDDDDDEYAEYD